MTDKTKSEKVLVSLTITKNIIKMIEQKKIKVGDRLPSERALARMLNVSRNSISEALHSLEALGIVDIKVGSGCYLIEQKDTMKRVLKTKDLFIKYNYHELLEAHSILQIGMVQIAAKKANRKDKIRLNELNLELKKIKPGDVQIADADYRFHKEIARTTDNTILIEMSNAISELLYNTYVLPLMSEEYRQKLIETHDRILEGIINNDPDLASEAMITNMQDRLIVANKYVP